KGGADLASDPRPMRRDRVIAMVRRRHGPEAAAAVQAFSSATGPLREHYRARVAEYVGELGLEMIDAVSAGLTIGEASLPTRSSAIAVSEQELRPGLEGLRTRHREGEWRRRSRHRPSVFLRWPVGDHRSRSQGRKAG